MIPKWKGILKFDTNIMAESFMVNHDVWEEAGGEQLSYRGKDIPSSLPRYATMEEIEKALGRKLNYRDFTFEIANFETADGHNAVRRHLGDSEYSNLLEYYSDRNNQKKSQEESPVRVSKYNDRETRKHFAKALEYFNE